MNKLNAAFFGALVVWSLPSSEAAAVIDVRTFGDLSLEQLMGETVTSVSRREQKLSDAAAAVTVISNDDIRRSGSLYLADIFRSVPGMTVSSINSAQWAVSTRGFNAVFTNKLLVLIDGRPVYTPLFSGVLWELQQPFLEDLDRIEVIRGPGATLWGSNAVNGVINIASLSARDTQGGLLIGGGGDVEESLSGFRYGGQVGEKTYYRVFGSHKQRDGFPIPAGTSSDPRWQALHGGFRIDHYESSTSHFTWQADSTWIDFFQDGSTDMSDVNTIARLTRDLGGDSEIELQTFYDRTYGDELSLVRNIIDTFDVALQHTFAATDRNTVVWGLGYRYVSTDLEQNTFFVSAPESEINQQLFSAYAQNEFAWVPDRFSLTTGVKLEHNTYTGLEIQPSVRTVFKPAHNHTIWAAVSRAVRTPSQVESGNALGLAVAPPFNVPGVGVFVPTVVGDGDPKSEVLWAFELGYRVQPTAKLNVDIATFYNHYDQLMGFGSEVNLVPGAPVGTAELPFANVASAETYGTELTVTYAVTESLRLRGGYSLLMSEVDAPPGVDEAEFQRTPRHQGSLGVSWDFARRASIDLLGRYVGSVTGRQSYFTTDVYLSFRPTEQLEVSLVGRNLLDPQHPEHAAEPFAVSAEVPRSFYGKVTWRF